VLPLISISEESSSKVPVSFVFPPTFRFFSIPTPPCAINAPVSLLVDSVMLLNVTSPSTSKVEFNVVAPSTSRVLLRVVAPSTC